MTSCNMTFGLPCNCLQGQSLTSDLEWPCIIPGHSMVNLRHLNKFFPNTLIFPCQHNSTNVPYSFFIRRQRCVIVKFNKPLNNKLKIGNELWALWRSILPKHYVVGSKFSGLTYKSRAKWKMLWGVYSTFYGEVNVSAVEKCVEIKGDYVEK